MNKGMISNPLNSINGQVAGVSMLPGREAMLNSVRVRGVQHPLPEAMTLW